MKTKGKEGLINLLKLLAEMSKGDPETAHGRADDAILEYIGDDEITEAYNEISKWYA